MSEVAERLKTELSQLSSDERAELADFLFNSLDETTLEKAEIAWEAELLQRLNDIHAGNELGEPAEKVLAELRDKHS